jgi:hypothetical protein
MYNLFRINAIDYSTLSSLAFAIYRTKFMKEENIPLLTGNIYDFIKLGYSGGAVDIYKPYGKNIYRYDVNSLYPSVMKPFDMPVRDPILFEGDILTYYPDAFGFFLVDVSLPSSIGINEPILLTRIKRNNTTKTIAPNGS